MIQIVTKIVTIMRLLFGLRDATNSLQSLKIANSARIIYLKYYYLIITSASSRSLGEDQFSPNVKTFYHIL